MKYFVYRKRDTNDQYWSVDKGWAKYDWATVYSQDEIDHMTNYGFDPSVLEGEWVRHEPPKPIPVIIGDNLTQCTVDGQYWYKHHTGTVGILYKGKGDTFKNGYMYVYISEPNWPV